MHKTPLQLFLFSILVNICLLVTFPVAADSSPQFEADNWQQWADRYDRKLRSDDGWLSLVGLYWLKQGNNSIGSAAGNDHRFPEDTPANLGTIEVNDKQLEFTRATNQIRIDGQDTSSQLLLENETTVSFGSYSFYIIKREKGYAIRLKNSANPAIANFGGAHFYPYADAWRIPARLVKHPSPQKITIATVYATTRENDSAGWLEFEYEGKTIRLQAVSYGPETPMAIMFADPTRLRTTYGAGRFLDVDWPQQGEMTVIDFNRAYNPPCAITAFATCPLPPPQNRMTVAVEAGELFDQHYE
jgi:uncharacterized protein (DUF1684 family)